MILGGFIPGLILFEAPFLFYGAFLLPGVGIFPFIRPWSEKLRMDLGLEHTNIMGGA